MKNILETFIEKVIVYNNRVVINMKNFSMMDMARNGGDETQHPLAIFLTIPKVYNKR